MFKNSLLVLFALSLTITASAADTTGAPQPIVSHEYWTAVWNRSPNADEAFLRGSWKMVAESGSKACQAMRGHNEPDYQKDGIKNSDGTLYHRLQFADFPVAQDDAPVLGVTISNIGGRRYNQGPFKTGPAEPQFAVWAYRGETPSKTAYLEHSCRKVSETQMICGVTVKGADSSNGKKCGASVNGIINVFDRE